MNFSFLAISTQVVHRKQGDVKIGGLKYGVAWKSLSLYGKAYMIVGSSLDQTVFADSIEINCF